jgi:hypothetical protein
MRQSLFEIVDRVFVKGRWHLWFWYERQAIFLAADPPQDCVHETRGASFSNLARQCDGVIDGGRGRNAIEIEQLKCRHPQNVQHFGIELFDRTSCERLDDDVE